MPRGDKSKYTDKEKRQAEHIEEGYLERGVSDEEAERRARVAAQPRRDARGVLVILRQSIEVMIERIEAGGGEDPHLPHRPAQHPPMSNARAYHIARPGEHRSGRRAQPLRQRR